MFWPRSYGLALAPGDISDGVVVVVVIVIVMMEVVVVVVMEMVVVGILLW